MTSKKVLLELICRLEDRVEKLENEIILKARESAAKPKANRRGRPRKNA